MNQNNDHQRFLPDQKEPIDREKIVVEIPADQPSPYQERIPSGYDPMGDIYLRGRASRAIADGKTAWWVLISGWVILLLFLWMVATSVPVSQLLIILLVTMVPLITLWRGMMAKIAAKNKKPQRRR